MSTLIRKTTQELNCFGIVYKVTCHINNKVYIGVTCRSVIKRWWGHTEPKKRNPSLLHKAVSKYGRDQFSIEVLSFAYSQEELNFLEKFLIYIHNANNSKFGYNIKEGGLTNWKHSPETKDKVRRSKLGFKHSEETKVLMSSQRKGIKKSPDHIAKIRAKHLGVKRSPEVVRNIREQARKYGNPITLRKDDVLFKFDSIREACRELNIARSSIQHVRAGRAKLAGGYEVLNVSE